MLTDPNVVH